MKNEKQPQYRSRHEVSQGAEVDAIVFDQQDYAVNAAICESEGRMADARRWRKQAVDAQRKLVAMGDRSVGILGC